jgi:hypothetical protein
MNIYAIGPFNQGQRAGRTFSKLLKKNLFLFFIFLSTHFVVAQGISSQGWPMPAGHQNGLVSPGFRIEPRFEFVTYGETKKLVLKMDVELSTPLDLVAPFSYRYMKNGKIYTDQQLGKDVFYPIHLKLSNFEVRVQGEGKVYTVLYESVIGHKEISTVNKDARTTSFTAFVIELKNVYYGGTENIDRAIQEYEAAAKAKKEQSQPLSTAKGIGNSPASQPGATEAKPTVKPAQKVIQTSATKQTDNFWSDKPAQSNGRGRAIPAQDSHKNLPDQVRTTDGGYFKRGVDGQFQEITADQYAQAKKANQVSSAPQQTVPTLTLEEVQASIKKSFDDDRARTEAFNQHIEQRTQVWIQNYYYAEAISNGKQNLEEISRLSGNYSSVAELEAEFKQKYSSIQAEVNNLEQARNAKLNNGVNGYFNENETERAVGQSIELIGNVVNSIQAEKEAKAAREALTRERERQRAIIIAAKKKAIMDMRNKLITSFPDGGTPLSSHKVSAPEVYLFAYIANRSSFANDQASIAVSNVFPVPRDSDGSYPYKITVVNKLKSLGAGDITLVGYYTDRKKAEEMHTAFLSLAQKSSLSVQPINYIPVKITTSKGQSNEDFWETEKKGIPPQKKKDNKDNFWDN